MCEEGVWTGDWGGRGGWQPQGKRGKAGAWVSLIAYPVGQTSAPRPIDLIGTRTYREDTHHLAQDLDLVIGHDEAIQVILIPEGKTGGRPVRPVCAD